VQKLNSKREDWKGRTVLVRGWVSEQNGPMIVLDNREQIDVVEYAK